MQLYHKNALNKVQNIYKIALNRVQTLNNGRTRYAPLPTHGHANWRHLDGSARPQRLSHKDDSGLG